MTPGADWITRWRVRAGYPVALLFLLLAQPTPASLSSGATVAAMGLLLRGFAAGYLHKHQHLAISGPYAFTRNPLYLGSAILAAGFVLAGASWIAAALVAGYFLVFYPAVMHREEAELRAHYGSAFEDFARRVPLFWPRLIPSAPVPPSSDRQPDSKTSESFSWAQYRRNREYQAAFGALLGLVVLGGMMLLHVNLLKFF